MVIYFCRPILEMYRQRSLFFSIVTFDMQAAVSESSATEKSFAPLYCNAVCIRYPSCIAPKSDTNDNMPSGSCLRIGEKVTVALWGYLIGSINRGNLGPEIYLFIFVVRNFIGIRRSDCPVV